MYDDLTLLARILSNSAFALAATSTGEDAAEDAVVVVVVLAAVVTVMVVDAVEPFADAATDLVTEGAKRNVVFVQQIKPLI